LVNLTFVEKALVIENFFYKQIQSDIAYSFLVNILIYRALASTFNN